MVALRRRPAGARLACFGLALGFALAPTGIGPHDPGAAQIQGSLPRWRELPAPFTTIAAAAFTIPRPLGTAMPEAPVSQVALGNPEITGALGAAEGRREAGGRSTLDHGVNRALKGDRLVPGRGAAPAAEPPAARLLDEADPLLEAPFAPDPDVDTSEAPSEEAEGESEPDTSFLAIANDPDPTERTVRLFFSGELLGAGLGAIEPWGPGDVPIVTVPSTPDPANPRPAHHGGESVAGKGEVTGEGRHPKSPAEELALAGKSRERAERCLANAIYFEARSEPLRGQIAVAQVVINRVFSGYYPRDVCRVVYQNAHRYLGCQFTFACDGIRDVVTEPDHWARAQRIARAVLDGRIWLPEVGKATHYHAVYVRPWWVRHMRKLQRIGLHTFYRPRKWGDGADAPSWGGVAAAASTAARL
jgi:hypothetical protein